MNSQNEFRPPNARELTFLRLVTDGYPELRAQIESCEIDDYDDDGYCTVRIVSGPSALLGESCDGPSLIDDPTLPEIDIILWLNPDGFLDSIEFVGYGRELGDIYQRFIDGAAASLLCYRHSA